MKSGLTKQTIEKIQSVFFNHPCIEKALLYGSRAKGTFKKGSDIDLTISGKGLNLSIMSRVCEELDDLLLPYTIDLSIYEQISNNELRQHIERVGVVFYEKPAELLSGIY
jgi:predicted nucleotidyltransferase